jgi:hypothetical protein
MLRVLPSEQWRPVDSHDPVGRILLLLAATIGLPYFVVSTTGPLIQAWYATSFTRGVPYRLYALSAFGSLLALLSYAFFFERALDLRQQAILWELGFAAFVLMCGFTTFHIWKNGGADPRRFPEVAKGQVHDLSSLGSQRSDPHRGAQLVEAPPSAPDLWRCCAWVALPTIASVTLLATTNYVCTDVSVVPFLWVMPLALYLVTFIIAFDHARWYRPLPTAVTTLVAIYGVVLIKKNGLGDLNLFTSGGLAGSVAHWVAATLIYPSAESAGLIASAPKIHVGFVQFLTLNLAALLGISLLCHGELYRQRPHPRYLTLYYLMIAAGGALGGVLVSLAAPRIFRTYFEWNAAILLGCLLAAGVLLRPIVLGGFLKSHATRRRNAGKWGSLALAVALPASAALFDQFSLIVNRSDASVQLRVTNFFGVLTIKDYSLKKPEVAARILLHGAIRHGAQILAPGVRTQPTTYYGVKSGVGRTLDYFQKAAPPGGMKIGAVGLGTGTLAAYVQGGDSISFYEINPAVIEIAESKGWFSFLQDCKLRGGAYDIKLGDARLTLQKELRDGQPQYVHMLVLDAFSGDAVPAHLLTEEAFEVYLAHLSTPESGGMHGAIAVHISNRYLDLDSVVRGAAGRFGLETALIAAEGDVRFLTLSSTWIILSYNQDLMDALQPYAIPANSPRRPTILWTDQRSNLFDVLRLR